MNDKKSVDWSVILLGFAAALFVGVLIVLLGGWAFSWAWGVFMVPVFALPSITLIEGIAAMVLLLMTGTALGLRRSNGNK